MCSALLPVTAVNDQSQVVLQSCFESYGAFDSGAGDSVQRSCNLIVKGLLLTRAVFPSFKVPKPLQWDAHWVSTNSRPKATGSRIPIRALPVNSPASTLHGHPEQSLRRCSPCMMVKRSGSLVEPASVP